MDSSAFSCIFSPGWEQKYIPRWLDEDIPSFDVGAAVVGDQIKSAKLNCKSEKIVIAGLPIVEAIFRYLGCIVTIDVAEGTLVEKTQVIARVQGPVYRLLQGERVSLNILSRLSGIATDSRRYSTALSAAGQHTKVAGTRKTTPGLRMFEKYALIVGGADPHRYDLSSCVMLKDNHIDAMGGDIAEAVRRAKQIAGFTVKVEVECRSLSDARVAAYSGADIVMLDNFKADSAHETAQIIKTEFPSVIVEVSGGIGSLEHLLAYAGPHIDIVSMGSLTHSHSTVDFSLKICDNVL